MPQQQAQTKKQPLELLLIHFNFLRLLAIHSNALAFEYKAIVRAVARSLASKNSWFREAEILTS